MLFIAGPPPEKVLADHPHRRRDGEPVVRNRAGGPLGTETEATWRYYSCDILLVEVYIELEKWNERVRKKWELDELRFRLIHVKFCTGIVVMFDPLSYAANPISILLVIPIINFARYVQVKFYSWREFGRLGLYSSWSARRVCSNFNIIIKLCAY